MKVLLLLIIANIISNYKFKHNRVHISSDHMYRCFDGLKDPHTFSLSLIEEDISFIHTLFKNTILKFFLIFPKYITNIVFGRTVVAGDDDPWIIATNGNPQNAINDYKNRWSIECLFKNQKSNGFYLESTKTKNINAFATLFGLMNIALT